jgi:hypothetical protein
MLVVIRKGLLRRSKLWLSRYVHGASIQFVIDLSVVILRSKAVPDLKGIVGADCHVPEVKQSVKVASQRKPVRHKVLTTARVWLYMCRFEYRHGMFSRDATAPVICIEYC